MPGETIPVTYRLKDQVNDGSIGPNFLYSLPSTGGLSSFLPILTPVATVGSQPAVNYLTPNNHTICGRAEVTISQPTVLGNVSVHIPRPKEADLVLTQSLALNHLQTEYRVIMVVPGLLLEEPPRLVPQRLLPQGPAGPAPAPAVPVP